MNQTSENACKIRIFRSRMTQISHKNIFDLEAKSVTDNPTPGLFVTRYERRGPLIYLLLFVTHMNANQAINKY